MPGGLSMQNFITNEYFFCRCISWQKFVNNAKGDSYGFGLKILLIIYYA